MRRTLVLLTLLFSLVPGPVRLLADEEPPVERITRTAFDKYFVRYSPDGTQLAYSRHHRNPRHANKILVGLRMVGVDGSNDRAVLPDDEARVQIQEHPCFSPDGERLLISGGGNDTGNSSKDIFVCDVDKSWRARNLRKVVDGASVMLGEEPCYSPDGKRICFVTIDETLWTVDANGQNRAQVVQLDGIYCHQPAWSPDGRWIAFATDRDGNVEIYKVRWDGTDLTRLTDDPGFDCRPRWSRDGRWLLFTSNRDGNHDLFVMQSDGYGVRPLTRHPDLDDHGDWSPDGRSIAFVSMRHGGFDLYRLPVPAELALGDPPAIDYGTTGGGDLLVHYDFDGPGTLADVVADRAGRNPLKLMGAVRVQEQGRGWLSLDGESRAEAGNALPLRSAGPLTLSVWLRPAGLLGNGYVLSKHGWNVYLGNGVPQFETRLGDNSGWDTLPAGKPLVVNTWQQLTAVFDSEQKQMLLYVDGELSARRDRPDGKLGVTDAYAFHLGQYTVSASQRYRGDLDEVRVYSRALSADEIRLHFREERPRVTGE